jgi:hypothetical protein
MESKIETQMESLLEELAREITKDVKEREILDTRIEKNKATFDHIKSSLNAYRPQTNDGTLKGKIITAIDSVPKSPFTGDDVLEQIDKLFPGSGIDRAKVSSIMWRIQTHKEAKNFRQLSKGQGRTPARYEKISGGVRVRTRHVELLATNGTDTR